MSFIGNLAKGFVRSAVNQVGRDGGRVISNKLYGDAHSIPMRNVGQKDGVFYNLETNEELTLEQLQQKIKEEGFKKTYFTSGILFKSLYYIFGIIATIFMYVCDFWYWIPAALLFVIAILKLFQRNIVIVYAWKDVATYKTDGRTRSGSRFVGYTRQKVTYTIPSTEHDKKIYLYIFLFYTFLSIAMLFGSKYYADNYMSNDNTEITVESTKINK